MTKHWWVIASVLLWTCSTVGMHDPLLGRWKLDAAASRSTEPVQTIDGSIIAELVPPRSIKVVYDRLRSDGTRRTLRYIYSEKCRDCSVAGGEQGLSVARQKLAERTYQTTWKLNGSVITRSTNVYSADLNTLTNSAEIFDRAGHHYVTVLVWRRQ